MKLRKVHRVPLSDAALEVFRSLAAVRIPGVDHIFAGASRGRRAGQRGPQALRRAMEKLGRRAYDPHGFRSTFSDWAHETTDYPHELIEKALAHQVGTKVARDYWRSEMIEKRQPLMADWARYCASGAAVVPFPALATRH